MPRTPESTETDAGIDARARRHSRLRGSLAGALTLALLASLSLMTATPASAAPGDATVSGHVSGGGDALEGVEINAYVYVEEDDDAWWDWQASTFTDEEGDYTLDLPAGTYRIGFWDPNGVWSIEYFDDQTDFYSAEELVLGAEQTRSGVDAVLSRNAHIGGHVTGDGNVLENIDVTAYAYVDDEDGGYWSDISSATTDENGDYTLAVPAGTYRVGFAGDGWVEEFFDGQADIDDADDVILDEGDTDADVDADLDRIGQVTGHVTGGGDGLESISITAYQLYDDGEDSYWDSVAWAYTDENGDYTLDLATGTYRIGFSHDDGSWVEEYYDDQDSVETADDVSVTNGSTTAGIDATLAQAGTIAGHVTGGGNDLGDISITAYQLYDDGEDSYWESVAWAYTDPDGTYSLHVPSGTYRIGFRDSEREWAAEYYNDKASVETADNVNATNGSTTGNVDAVLARTGAVSGRVTGAGSGLDDVWVTAYRLVGEDWDYVDDAYTDANGDYTLRLPAGTYRIGFSADDSAWVEQYWNNKPTLETATNVTVTSSATTSGVNAALTRKGGVSGHVTGGGDALADIHVAAYRYYPDGGGYWDEYDSTHTDDDGNYTLNLPSGTYRIGFHEDDDDLWSTVYYNGAADVESATNVQVTAPNVVTGINANLLATSSLAPITNTAPHPTITGSPVVGQTLHASVGTWTPTGVNVVFRWYDEDDELLGSGPDLLVSASMKGSGIYVEVIASKIGHQTYYSGSDLTDPVTGDAPMTCQQAQAQQSAAATKVAGATAQVTGAQKTVTNNQASASTLQKKLKKAKKAKAKAKVKKLKKKVKKANAAVTTAKKQLSAAQTAKSKALAAQTAANTAAAVAC